MPVANTNSECYFSILKAEEDYYRKKQKEEQARLRGDDKWILPSVEARIKGDKDKEKKKKHKKKKKKAKKKRKSSSSVSTFSHIPYYKAYSFQDSDDDSEDEEWVEKGVDVPSKTGVGALSEQNGKKTDPLSSGKETEKKSISEQSQEKSKVPTERDEWMTLPGLFPSVSREQLRQQSGRLSKAEEQRQKDRYMLDNLGQSDRELNPYWKDGGTGLPQEEEHERGKKELHSLPAKAVGDQGVDWLRRALKRAKEQAAEEGRTLEEVAAERWGSLEKLETLIAEAEEKSGRQRKQGSNQREYDKYEQESRRNSWKKNTHDTDGTRKPDSERRSDRNDQDRISSSSRSFHKPRDDDSPHRHRDSCESTSRSFRTPRDDRDEEVGCSKRDWNSERHSKRSFQKPGEDIDLLERGDFRIHEKNVPDSSKYRSSASSGNWRKKTSGDQKVYVGSNKPKDVKSSKKAESSSSSPSSDDDGNEEEKKGEESAMLTDKEMNDLGAKLVKAEILGNETLAKELKKKLDAARAVRTMKPKETSDTKSVAKDEEETVVLTRTDSKGFIHPIKQTGQHAEPVGGRRRKQKMETHVDGKRVRYFADDDKYSLKDLFEREKLSTARDEEEMISKLAGKVTDNDDMDDIFAERVRQKESDGKIQARERSQAIKEHKIVDRVLENCNWCFDSKAMLKHLIVAIGNKVQLLLHFL
ncbi:hypothetical protein ANN_22246 [Periplaneta americana]|uniref:Cwf19-like C-terminal domain-containing protein n=1 Tax=Periplaneta americana TaxID=6978 RepID=A0ABQ8S7V0_PERAM|nr:hypothetical protein ANN_22246 [Periplaneta americana]